MEKRERKVEKFQSKKKLASPTSSCKKRKQQQIRPHDVDSTFTNVTLHNDTQASLLINEKLKGKSNWVDDVWECVWCMKNVLFFPWCMWRNVSWSYFIFWKARRKSELLAKQIERTCTDPCLSAGVRLPSVPCLGTSGHAATPPLFVFFCMTVYGKVGVFIRAKKVDLMHNERFITTRHCLVGGREYFFEVNANFSGNTERNMTFLCFWPVNPSSFSVKSGF